jgi:hypothetical protein
MPVLPTWDPFTVIGSRRQGEGVAKIARHSGVDAVALLVVDKRLFAGYF